MPATVTLRRAAAGLAAITALYLAALIWADSRNHVFSALPALLATLPVLAGLSLASYAIRYARWWWLLARAGHRTRVGIGFVAYLAGFAFTATPGKVGELLRIRYLEPEGVPPYRVVAAFVYERAFDLVVVLALTALAIDRTGIVAFVAVFVIVSVAAVVLCARHPSWIDALSAWLRLARFPRLERIVTTLRDGLSTSATWATPVDVGVALVSGFAAWSITAGAFVWLLGRLGIAIAPLTALGIYPLAMLAGAASMLPGGIGSTETAIVAMLALAGVSVAQATLAAVGIRLASLWFAVSCGFVAAVALEWRIGRAPDADRATPVGYDPPGADSRTARASLSSTTKSHHP